MRPCGSLTHGHVRAHGLTRPAAVQLLMKPALPRPPSLPADPSPFQMRQHVDHHEQTQSKGLCSSCRGNHCIPHCESRRKTHLSPGERCHISHYWQTSYIWPLSPSSDHQWCLTSKTLFHVMVLQSRSNLLTPAKPPANSSRCLSNHHPQFL